MFFVANPPCSKDNFYNIVDFLERQVYYFDYMSDFGKKEKFKSLIEEFYSIPLPEVLPRNLEVPLNTDKVITVFGPRRGGKTFYFYFLIKKLINQGIAKEQILYINFEDDRILPLEYQDLNWLLEAYFELYPEMKQKITYLFFDEIQNIKNWEIFVRRIKDKEKVKVFLTGSSSKLLSKEIATSLRGRTLSFALYPLDFKEFLVFKGEKLEKNFIYSPQRFKIKKLLEEYLEFGGFPEVVLERQKALKLKILQEYFDALVYRDLEERFHLENTALLYDLLRFVFSNTTAAFSVSNYFNAVKQKMAVSRETISNYLSYIQETRYLFLLPNFSYSLKTQAVNPRKIIILDNGLRNAVSFQFSKDEGKLAENLAGSLLARRGINLYYWKNNQETDFVFAKENHLCGINVCFGDKIEEREISSLLEFKEKHKNVKELILITKDNQEKIKGIQSVPLWQWLLE